MKIAITIIIALAIFIFHYWACRRSPKYWYIGGIIPFVWICLLVILYCNGMIDFRDDWRVLTFPTLIIFLMWIEGRQSAKKKEMAKMKAKDIE